MGFFSSSRPVITPKEFDHRVREDLYNHGFSRHKLDHVQSMISGYMNADKHSPSAIKGMDAKDVDSFANDLGHEKHGAYSLDDKEVSMVRESLKKHL